MDLGAGRSWLVAGAVAAWPLVQLRMTLRIFRWLIVGCLLASFVVACGGTPEGVAELTRDSKRLALSDDFAGTPAPVWSGLPTATLYPTFTPAPPTSLPLPTATALPTPTMLGYLPPTPTLPASTPTAPAPVFVTMEPTEFPETEIEVLPVEVGLHSTLSDQTLFGLHTIPAEGESLPEWPEPQTHFLSRTARMVVWVPAV